ncbi:MAG: alpha/beta fold hydrolase [Leptolyngbyaceae cyanobacterium]
MIWGRQDKIVGTKDAAKFATRMPQAQLVWIDNCGDVPHLEQAAAVADAIQNWLADN